MEWSVGWVFPIFCLAMMVLCFLTMSRRAGRGGFVGGCLGRRIRDRESSLSDGEIAQEVARLRGEVHALSQELGVSEHKSP